MNLNNGPTNIIRVYEFLNKFGTNDKNKFIKINNIIHSKDIYIIILNNIFFLLLKYQFFGK